MNDLLDRWAEDRAMPPARAEAIRRRIVEDAAPELGVEWWRDLFAPLKRSVAPAWRPQTRSV